MIDVHCHILPALDDGALDMEDSLAMARLAQDDGINLICATPHIHPDHDVRVEDLQHRVDAVNAELSANDVSTRVTTGGEVAQQTAISLDEAELRLVSLGGGERWLLLEPAPGPIGADLVKTIERLDERGFSCVVAHPERHAGERFTEWLTELVERGALIQVTAALIADGPASQTMLDLAGLGLVHLIGSDAHSSHGGRPATISQGVARLREIDRVASHLEWVTEAGPAALLAGEPATPPFPVG